MAQMVVVVAALVRPAPPARTIGREETSIGRSSRTASSLHLISLFFCALCPLLLFTLPLARAVLSCLCRDDWSVFSVWGGAVPLR
eukprot:COSAG06_NODE_1586_length_9011_cov_83.566652_1_plen_85_part_00